MEYPSAAICDMLLDESNHREGTSKLYRYEKSRLLPVVGKIVESITLNVVNCSGNFDAIPAELLNKRSHRIDSHTFAAAAMAISRSSGDVIIRCNRFLADLYVWLLSHIEGDISLSTAGKISHRATFERPLRSVTMLADEACSEEHDEIASALVISLNVGGAISTLLRHTADHAEIGGSCLKIRQSLYDLLGQNRAGRIKKTLTPQELCEVIVAGQSIVRWLMNRPAFLYDSFQFVYSTQLDDDRAQSDIHVPTVDTLLGRWPAICNEDFGPGTSTYNFEVPNHLGKDNDLNAETISVRDVLNCFPHARAIVEHACTRCQCTSCRTEVSGTGQNHGVVSKPGCLAYLAEDYLCLFIAHAIADGFGIPDASNLRDSSVIRYGVRKLMSELLFDRRIAWETWFSLAACTYLGCQWVETKVPGEKSAELVAIQHGFEVVVASWVDLRRGLASQGSFGYLIATGQLCDIETDFGVLYTEETSPRAGTISDRKQPESHSMTANISEISLQSTITVIAQPFFRLTTIAKAGNYLRIINPATVLLACDRNWTPKCNDFCHGAPA
jgi:hypothetical protein